MKFLIIYKRPSSMLRESSGDRLNELLEVVEQARSKGIVDGIYGLVEGGLVAIVTAEDHAALSRGLRKFGILDAEVYPLHDVTDLIRRHLEERASAIPN